jgi:hypothetical protein
MRCSEKRVISISAGTYYNMAALDSVKGKSDLAKHGV